MPAAGDALTMELSAILQWLSSATEKSLLKSR